MENSVKWNYSLPKKEDCGKLVFATLTTNENNIYVNEVYIDDNGQFLTWDCKELQARVIAWSHYPEPALDTPF